MTTRDMIMAGRAPSRALPPEFEALSALVRQARQGELRIADAVPAAAAHPNPYPAEASDQTALPAGLYRDAPAPERPWPPEVRAGLWGLAAGLVLLVPLIIFLREPVATKPVSAASTTEAVPAIRPANAASPIAAINPPALDPLQMLNEIEAAQQLIRSGDIVGARTQLAKAAAANSPRALFLMAETHDPNTLAAWGTRGVTADALQARSLYAAANALGHPLAESRLKALE